MQHRGLLRRAAWTTVTAIAALVVTSGCALLDSPVSATGEARTPGEGGAPYLVVTVGGSPAATPTLTVAETIPDSTPLPRIQSPTPDPAATRKPVASPSIMQQRGGSPAQRAARPPDNLVPVSSPVAATP